MSKKIATMTPYRDRHPKTVAAARCCWVCGKLGGAGFTHALRGAGFRMAPREMAYAHPKCMVEAMREAAARERAS